MSKNHEKKMEKLAHRLTDYLIQRGGEPEKRDIYRYAVELTLSTLFGCVAILILSFVSIGFRYGVIFLLFFFPSAVYAEATMHRHIGNAFSFPAESLYVL